MRPLDLSVKSWIGTNNDEVLSKFLNHEKIRNLPVVCLSINGQSRTYKSFLLANIIKYFRHRHENSNWIEQEFGKNVEWRHEPNGKKVTTSVSLWLEPFVVSSGSKEFIVILLDTPGIDNYSNIEKKRLIRCFLIGFSLLNIYLQLRASPRSNQQCSDTDTKTERSKNLHNWVLF